MLTLRRWPGEEIKIWKDGVALDVRIVVLGIQDDGSIKLGFEASSDINIDRLEIYRRKRSKSAAPTVDGVCAPSACRTRDGND